MKTYNNDIVNKFRLLLFVSIILGNIFIIFSQEMLRNTSINAPNNQYSQNTSEIYSSGSSTPSINWTDNRKIMNTIDSSGWGYGPDCYPSIALDQSKNLFFLHRDRLNFGDSDVWISNSSDYQTFSSNRLVVRKYNANVGGANSLIIIPNGSFYAAYEFYSGSSQNIELKESSDSITWNSEKAINPISTYQFDVSLYFDPSTNYLYAVYRYDSYDNHDIALTRSNDGGNSWSSPIIIADGPADLGFPILLKDSNGNWDCYFYDHSHLSNESQGRISHVVSSSWNSGWSQIMELPTGNMDFSDIHYPSGFVDKNGYIWIFYEVTLNDIHYIYYQISLDNGSTWSNPILIDNTTNYYNPSVAYDADSNRIFLVSVDATISGAWCHKLLIGTITSGSAGLAPNPPVLNPITPNPDHDGDIILTWSQVIGATSYYIYRSTSQISSTAGLTPIANVNSTFYTDTELPNGT
ncbi:MAG: exo-alpha-sialidase, partial [Promethearchaeota archaeon]